MRYFFTFSAIATLLITLVVGCQQNTEPTAEPTAESPEPDVTLVTFANERCPIMEGEPTPELTRQWDGKTIGFCCEGCPEKWDAMSEEEKAAKFAKASSGEGKGHGEHDHAEHEHADHEHDHGEQSGGSHAEQPDGSGQDSSQNAAQ